MDDDTPRPNEGGSFVVEPDGTLRQVEGPALDAPPPAEPPPAEAPPAPAAGRRRAASQEG